MSLMQGNCVAVSDDLVYSAQSIRASNVCDVKTDINALAVADKKSISVLAWNYHDDDIVDAGSPVEIKVDGINAKEVALNHYRIDTEHSNSYTAWKAMGAPQKPTAEQIKVLEKSSELALLQKPTTIKVKNHQATIKMQLPRQAVSLIKLTY